MDEVEKRIMGNLIEIQKKIVPDILMVLKKRYALLKEISANGSIGRRLLSQRLNLSERTVRTEVDFLKAEGFINIESSGMKLTDKGKDIIDALRDSISEINGLNKIEDILTKRLGIKKIVIAESHHSDEDEVDSLTLEEMGKLASRYFISQMEKHQVVGITGGTTMYAFTSALPQQKDSRNQIVVPARGGLAEDVEIQSNNVAAMLSKKIHAQYKLLHIPDNVDKSLINSIISIPSIRDTVDTIENIDILVFGIGNAMDMAIRRKNSEEVCEIIRQRGAVAEAFGYYFDIHGEIVYETSTVGIQLESYKKLQDIIGIAGGKKKAKAILSISKINKNLVLITDESAARYLMDLTGGFDNI